MTIGTLAGRFARFLLLALAAHGFAAHALVAPPDPAAAATALKAKYAQIRPRLEANAFGRPLALDSLEALRDLKGDAYAIVNHPFAQVQAALAPAQNWCEVLLLPFNTKYCETGREGRSLTLFVGRKNETPIDKAYRLDFTYALAARTRDYLQLVLECGSGPLGTRDYRIVLEATPIDDGRTFLHLTYAYAYGTVSKLAMQAYLATVGAGKVGFSSQDGELVRGMRGAMERNTMRHFLAIDAYLASLQAPHER